MMSLADLLTEIDSAEGIIRKPLCISQQQLRDIKLLICGSGRPVYTPGFSAGQATILGLPYEIVEHGCPDRGFRKFMNIPEAYEQARLDLSNKHSFLPKPEAAQDPAPSADSSPLAGEP